MQSPVASFGLRTAFGCLGERFSPWGDARPPAGEWRLESSPWLSYASNPRVSGSKLLKRILLVLGVATAMCLFLAVVDADATPLRPDIRKLVTQPRDTVQFAPARAGWDGPEDARRTASAAQP